MFTNEPQLFKTVLQVLKLAKSFADVPDPENMRAITAFSDSVVVTSGGPFGTAGLFATVGVLAGELLKRGILCRGGIARGRMYHADGILFGEALVRAYDLERHVAKMPRIVIDDDVAPAVFFLIDDQVPAGQARPRWKAYSECLCTFLGAGGQRLAGRSCRRSLGRLP
ncbi:MAG TPA: hypothetical protein VJV03_20170, partial [Pyrinomonadaceae bacterium]|nr:hypothetical protein [Pyrinomonadaceae bacterium]